MQNIDGHYIRWNEANQKFQLVNNVKCNMCDESMANKLAFLGFLGNLIFSFVLTRKEMRNSFNLLLVALAFFDSCYLIGAQLESIR